MNPLSAAWRLGGRVQRRARYELALKYYPDMKEARDGLARLGTDVRCRNHSRMTHQSQVGRRLLAEDVERLLANRPTAHDQHGHVLARERSNPLGIGIPETAVPMNHGVVEVATHSHQWNSRWTPPNGSGV